MLGWSISARACRSASKRAIDLAGVHARLDDLQRHLAADRLLLLGHEDDAEAAFADLLQELVGADQGANPLVRQLVGGHQDQDLGRVEQPPGRSSSPERRRHLRRWWSSPPAVPRSGHALRAGDSQSSGKIDFSLSWRWIISSLADPAFVRQDAMRHLREKHDKFL